MLRVDVVGYHAWREDERRRDTFACHVDMKCCLLSPGEETYEAVVGCSHWDAGDEEGGVSFLITPEGAFDGY